MSYLKTPALAGRSLFIDNRDRDLAYLELLDADRLLYSFRRTFGQPVNGAEPPHGWEEPDGLLRGHSLGHFMSALAIAVQYGGGILLRDKLTYIVGELLRLQAMSGGDPAAFVTACTPEKPSQSLYSADPSVWGEGYVGAYPPDQFALLEKLTPYAGIWAPYYTLHKLLAGLIDAHERAGTDGALDCARGIGRWIYRRLSPLDAGLRRKMWGLYIAGEYGGMNEALARLAMLTGDGIFADAARLFDNGNIFPALAEKNDPAIIAELHANQHIPQLVGAMAEYEATGDEFYLRAARSFWNAVVSRYAYSIGGVGRGERFRQPGAIAANIDGETNCETCAAYNMLKLTAALYAHDPENADYMDYYERTLYNQIAASQNPRVRPRAHHGVTYMLPIGPGARRSYSDDYHSFTCCHGTGMENHVKYPEHVYFYNDGTVYINLLMPSEINADGVHIKITSDFPFPNAEITLRGDAAYTAAVRLPKWCGDFRVETDAETETSGSYVRIAHKAGEITEVCIKTPYRAVFEPAPDKIDGATVASLRYGPFVMAALGDAGEGWLTVGGDTSEYRAELNRQAGSFYLTGGGRRWVPMYAAHNTAYHAYVKIK